MSRFPHQPASQTLMSERLSCRMLFVRRSYNQMRRQRELSSSVATVGSQAGSPERSVWLWIAPCVLGLSAPCPATPNRMDDESGDQSRYSTDPSTAGAADAALLAESSR